ncbi:hypothetical protein ES708_16856 [subsurface metagenome]
MKADIKVKSLDGDFLTDFDIEMIPVSTEEKNSNTEPFIGMYGALLGNNIYGKINGGGLEIRLTTLDGDVYFRKAE